MASPRAPVVLPTFFDLLPSAERAELSRQARVRNLKKGEQLWGDAEPVSEVVCVRTGCLAAVLSNPMAGEEEGPSLVATFTAEQFVGRSLTEIKPAFMAVRAITPSSVVSLPVPVLRPMVLRTPALYEALTDYLMRTLYQQRFHLSRLVRAPVERKLAHVLWSLSRVNRQGRRVIEFKVAQADLARMVGTDRSELSRKKQMLLKTGVIKESEDGLELTPVLQLMLLGEQDLPSFLLTQMGST